MSKTYVTLRAQERELEEVDADDSLSLVVTARDIKLAKAANSKECALARACKRELHVKAAYLLRTVAWLEYPDKMVRYRLPQSVQKEIVSFDRSKMMSTGEYTLAPVAPMKRGKGRARARSKVTGKRLLGRGKAATKIVSKRTHELQDVRTKFEPREGL
jgi:hypothetical protein